MKKSFGGPPKMGKTPAPKSPKLSLGGVKGMFYKPQAMPKMSGHPHKSPSSRVGRRYGSE